MQDKFIKNNSHFIELEKKTAIQEFLFHGIRG